MTIYYASQSGTGNGLSQGSPFKISNFLSTSVAGDHLYILDGAYTGSTSMLIPPSGKSGTSANPITISALNDGNVFINGQNSLSPFQFNANTYWIIEGINFGNSSAGVVLLNPGSNNNIIRRCAAWNANSSGNEHVWQLYNSSNNLIEDCVGFGTGRKIFEFFGGSDTNILRRCFGIWHGSTSESGPIHCFAIGYDSRGNIAENCIGTRDEQFVPAGGYFGLDSIFTTGDRLTDAPCTNNNAFYGCIGFILSSQTYNNGGNGIILAVGYDFGTFKDIVLYKEAHPNAMALLAQDYTQQFGACNSNASGGNKKLINFSEIGFTVPDNIATGLNGWTQTNFKTGSTVSSIYGAETLYTNNGSKGATIRYRYVNGSLTTTELWPWPMNQRIIDALALAGRSSINVNTTIQGIFGSFPTSSSPLLTTAYVSPTGNDANTGTTSATPLKTLSYAFSRLAASGTLNVMTGTFPDIDPQWHTIRAGTAALPTIIQAFSGSPIIKPSSATPTGSVAHFYSPTCHHIAITGLTFDATNVTGSNGITINDETGTGAAHDITFTNCTVKNSTFSGFDIDTPTSANSLVNCNILSNLRSGIFMTSGSNTINNCVIHDNGSIDGDCGIKIVSGNANIIKNNSIYFHNWGSNIRVSNTDNTLIYNNLVYYGSEGIYAFTGSTNTGIYNNTVYSHFNFGIGASGTTNLSVRNNITYANSGTEPIQVNGSASYIADHNLAATNPQFVSAGSDFHLTASSAAIDNGTNLSAIFTTDKDGNGRSDIAYDLGAYEFQTTGGTFARPPFIPAGSTVRTPTIKYLVSLPTITTGAVVRTPTIAATAAQSLLPPTITSTAIIRIPTVALRLTLPFLTNTATLSPPAIGLTVRPPALSSGAIITIPTVRYIISGPTLVNSSSIDAPTVFVDIPGVQLVFPAKLTNTNTLYAPTITLGAVTLLPPTIATSSTTYDVTLAYGVESATLTSAAAFFFPAVALAGSQAIIAASLTNTSTLYDLTITTTTDGITTPTISSTATLYPPGLETLLAPTIASGSLVYAPTTINAIELPALTTSTHVRTPMINGGVGSAGQPPAFITVFMWKRIS